MAEHIFQEMNNVHLSNGIQVILMPDPSRELVAAHIWVKTGVINETATNSGISHFIEHMLFKGTVTRPLNTIQHEVESKGGMINAATSKDFTFYHINTPTQYWAESLEILADMVQNAAFDSQELEKERLVILEEISRQNDEPQSVLWNKLNERMFPELPYKMATLGTAETIRGLSRGDLVKYYNTYYQPNNFIVILAGGFDKEEALKKIKQLFAKGKSSPQEKEVVAETNEMFVPENPLHLELPFRGNVVYHIWGYAGPALDDNDIYALDVAAAILGHGRSSRLYSLLYEKEKIVFDISAGFLGHKKKGFFFVSSRYAPSRIKAVEERVLFEINRLANEDIPEEELAKAKRILETGFILDNQTPDEKATTLGYYAAVDVVKEAREYIKKINAVQRNDIQRVVQKYLLKNYISVFLNPGGVKGK